MDMSFCRWKFFFSGNFGENKVVTIVTPVYLFSGHPVRLYVVHEQVSSCFSLKVIE